MLPVSGSTQCSWNTFLAVSTAMTLSSAMDPPISG